MNRIRIYRTRNGWTAEQYTPAGGRVRNTYPTGQAVLIALDPRNRPKQPGTVQPAGRVSNPLAMLGESFLAMLTAPGYIVHDAIKPGSGKAAFARAFPHLTGRA